MAQCHEREREVSSYSRGLVEEKRSRYGWIGVDEEKGTTIR